mgnify:FL=1|jgi:hypothetical protein
MKKSLEKIVFWLHFLLIVIWFGLFFIPSSLWQGRVLFHFWYVFSIMFIQLIWALILRRKIDIICPLTTWLQSLRGYSVKSKKNYGHSYIAELLERLGVRVSYFVVNVILLITLVLVSWLYWIG